MSCAIVWICNATRSTLFHRATIWGSRRAWTSRSSRHCWMPARLSWSFRSDVVRHSLDLQRDALNFVSSRHDLGFATGLDLAQQQALLDASATQLELQIGCRAP